ncbi:SymE family type I addiction module toxin [Paraburkholderia tropica]|uniref:SymE family type I addiction module toxin n=1 Tax=Paraburkholderia tropica TaxID=92647 RepID=UPI0038B74C2F
MRIINQPTLYQSISSRTVLPLRRVHVSRVSVFTSIPYIRLKGNWLRDAGFSFQDEINVHVYNKRLVVCVAQPLEIPYLRD